MKLLIVDDDPLIAEDLADLCEEAGIPAAHVSYNPGDALNFLSKNPVDLVLLDVNLEAEIDGIDIADFINSRTKAKIIFLTSYSDEKTVSRVIDCKPVGYIVKPFNKVQLVTTLELFIKSHSDGHEKAYSTRMEAISLTEKEKEIMKLIMQGKSNARIAEVSKLSINTVKFHLKNIYSKADVGSKSELLTKMMG